MSRKIEESSEKLLKALLISQISKDDYPDFHDFSVCVAFV
jgi:HEPN domain-containing protein